MSTPLRDPNDDTWDDTDVDLHFAAAFGLGAVNVELVGDDGDGDSDDEIEQNDADSNDLDIDFILRISGKRVERSELLGKNDPKGIGIKGIEKRNPLEVRCRKKELEEADASFGSFVAQNVQQPAMNGRDNHSYDCTRTFSIWCCM